jgi:hypothetical protein
MTVITLMVMTSWSKPCASAVVDEEKCADVKQRNKNERMIFDSGDSSAARELFDRPVLTAFMTNSLLKRFGAPG